VACVPDLDLDDLVRRCATAAEPVHPGARLTSLRRLEGGVSSLTFAAVLETPSAQQPVVVKVAPPGLAPVRNRDVLRQARVLRALAGLDGFPVPAVLFEDAGEPPEVPPLFVMELRPGESYEALLDVSPAPPTAEVAAERMRVAARSLARLHLWSPASLGLSDEPVTPVAEELARWERLFATVDRDIGTGHEELSARLAERVPADGARGLLHGDYRVANMLFTGARLEAVIDWEIWSVGDPRSDLAWLLMHTAPAQVFHERRPAADVEAGRLVPDAAALVGEYAAARSALGSSDAEIEAATSELAWFLAVCHFKTASTIAVIHKRDRRSARPTPRIAVAAARLDDVLQAGHRVLDAA
jgi:aminoglycoside phosphotransferase (APT) family kinase protein